MLLNDQQILPTPMNLGVDQTHSPNSAWASIKLKEPDPYLG